MANLPISGRCPELFEVLKNAGLLPDNTCRVIIDIAFDNVVKIYYEVIGDTRLLEIDFAKHLSPLIKQKETE